MCSPRGRRSSVWAAAIVSLLAMGSVSVLGAVPAVHATDPTISITTSNGPTVCLSLGGTWDAGTDTCSFSSGLTIDSTTTLDIGAGVTVDGYGSWYAIVNSGTINNNGTITGGGGQGGTGDFCRDGGIGGDGIVNSGTINNDGTVTGGGGTGGMGGWCIQSGADGGTGGDGIANSGTVNNVGTITGDGGTGGDPGKGIPVSTEPPEPGCPGDGGSGIGNSGTINNNGTITGGGGTGPNAPYCANIGGPGIANSGTVNNDGRITGDGGIFAGDGIYNNGLVNDYCGVALSYSSYDGTAPNTISCYPVTFEQSGIPTSWVIWGVTVAWGPFVLPVDHTGTGSNISMQATGTLSYSYDTPVKFTGTIYDCGTGCSGWTSSVSGPIKFSADYTVSGSYNVVTTITVVTCARWSVFVDTSTTCTATVTGSSPTGAVMFSTSVGTESQFSSTTCALSSGTCHVPYTPTSTDSPVTIMAIYEGDQNNAGSSGTFSLTVTGPSITPSNGGAVCPSLGGKWDGTGAVCSFSSGLTISSTMTLDIGAGVIVAGTGGQGVCGVSGGTGISNSGTINNEGIISGSGGNGGDGCTITQGVHRYQGPGGTGGAGIANSGTINNQGMITGNGGQGGSGGPGGRGGSGIANSGTMNNDGTATGSGGTGGYQGSGYGPSGTGISNPGLINDFCGAGLSYSSYSGNPPNAISCYTVTFEQNGIPSGATWGVTVSWQFGTTVHTGTGGSIAVANLGGSITYSFSTPVTSSGTTYYCASGCSATSAVSGPVMFSASYATSIAATTTSLADSVSGSTAYGTSVTFTATISPTPDSGTVDFTFDGFSIAGCVSVSLSGGMASCVTTYLPAGSDTVTATYSGYADHAGSSGTDTVTVAQPSPNGVPQFPLGLPLLFAIMVAALLVLRKTVVSPSPRTCAYPEVPGDFKVGRGRPAVVAAFEPL